MKIKVGNALLSIIFLLSVTRLMAHPGLQEQPGHGGSSTGFTGSTAPNLFYYQNERSHAGYGYLGRSESDAATAMNFSCSERDQNAYIRSSCHLPRSAPIRDLGGLRQVNQALIQERAAQRLRLRLLEHLGTQLWAIGGRANETFRSATSQSCFGNSDSAPEVQLITRLQRTNPPVAGQAMTGGQLRGMRPHVPDAQIDRTNLITSQLGDENLLQAIVTAGYFINASNASNCQYMVETSNSACRSINRTLFRLKSSFPMIFDSAYTSTGLTADAREILQTTLPAGFQAAGNQTAEQALQRVTSGTALTTSTGSANILGPSQLGIDAITVMQNRRQGQALRSGLQSLRTSYQSTLEAQVGHLCGADLEHLIRWDAAGVRQFLVDEAARGTEDLNFARLALCTTDSFSRKIRPTACGRVAAEFNDSTRPGRKWYRGSQYSNYPFSGNINYAIERTRSGGHRQYDITVNIHFLVDPGATLDMAQMGQWRDEAQTYFQEQARRFGYHANFIIGMSSSNVERADALNIHYHQCWCSTCNSSRPAPNNVPPSKETCASTTPGAPTFGRMLQADSSNFHASVDRQTVFHEIAHGLGLPDEYQNSYYPFNPLGQENSLMSSGDVMYRRHFQRIFNPNTCE